MHPEQIQAVVDAVAPKPVNLLVGSTSELTMQAIAALGVRRVSVGGALARAAWGGFMRAARMLAEEGRFDHPATRLVAEEYLHGLREAGVDALVLGCTHYPMLKPLLGDVMGPATALIDSAEETARALEAVLGEYAMAAPAGATGWHRLVVSDDQARFLQVGSRFVGERLTSAEVVAVG